MEVAKKIQLSKYNKTHTHIHSQRLWQHTQVGMGLYQIESQHWEQGEVDTAPHPQSLT